MTQHWWIDFDDTLAIGPITWALQYTFPRLIEEHQLPYEPARFTDAVLAGQQLAVESGDENLVLDHLFKRLGWPDSVNKQLLRDVFDTYVPALFEDTVPFLEYLSEQSHLLYIVSNNNHAGDLAQKLGIGSYFADVITPGSCGGLRGKPWPEMGNYLRGCYPLGSDDRISFVGDDPWSDGAFASQCQIEGWIVDRQDRFANLDIIKSYQRVRTLSQIGIKIDEKA